MFLMGCWDKIEIEDRAYAITIGVDLNQDEDNQLSITFAFPNPSAVLGESDEPVMKITGAGDSIYEVMRSIGTRSNRQIYLGHFRTVLIGEEVAKRPELFRGVLDALEKDPHVSRKVNIGIVEGTAKEVLDIKPSLGPDITQFIRQIFEHDKLINRAPLQTLNEIFEFMHRSEDGLITRIIPGATDVKVAGAAVFKDFEFLGYIGEEVNRGLMFLQDEADIGIFTVEHNDQKIPIEVTDTKTKYKLAQTDNDFKIIVEISMEGDIRQLYFDLKNDVLETGFLHELGSLLESRIKANVNHSLGVLQNEYGVDLVGFDEYIEKFHPKIWGEIKDEYDEIFPQMDVVIEVDAEIRRIGLSK